MANKDAGQGWQAKLPGEAAGEATGEISTDIYYLYPAYYNDNFFLKHRKKRSSGGSTVSSADNGRWMSTCICRSNGRYLISAPSCGRYFL
jgi:hypothetical protein